jgi:hypothetical protein
LLGPRQVGKTTLALEIAKQRPSSIYLDLESDGDQAKLSDPQLYLAEHEDKLVILARYCATWPTHSSGNPAALLDHAGA